MLCVHLEDVLFCLCHIDLSPLNYMTFLESEKQSWCSRRGGGVVFIRALVGVQTEHSKMSVFVSSNTFYFYN